MADVPDIDETAGLFEFEFSASTIEDLNANGDANDAFTKDDDPKANGIQKRPAPSKVSSIMSAMSLLTLDNLKWVLLRMALASLILCWLLASSIGAYSLLYRLYIPVISHELPVNFTYDWPNPTKAQVPLVGFKFHPGVRYDFMLDLSVPDIPLLAQKVGNFMTGLQIGSERMSVSSLLPYRSNMLRIALTGAKLVPLMLGWTDERLSHRIFIAKAVSIPKQPSVSSLVVELSTNKIPIIDAKLLITAHLTGIRYWLYHWRITSAVVFIGALFCGQAFLLASGLFIWFLTLRMNQDDNNDEDDLEEDDDGDEIHEKLE